RREDFEALAGLALRHDVGADLAQEMMERAEERAGIQACLRVQQPELDALQDIRGPVVSRSERAQVLELQLAGLREQGAARHQRPRFLQRREVAEEAIGIGLAL